MKLITIYETFDSQQFTTFEEALHYEYEVRKVTDFIRNEVLFLDDKNPIIVPEKEDLWEQFYAIEKAYDECKFLVVQKEIPPHINQCFRREVGIELPTETGIYIYDEGSTSNDWKKVGEYKDGYQKEYNHY